MSHSSVPTDKDCCGVCGAGDKPDSPLMRCSRSGCGCWACPSHISTVQLDNGRTTFWCSKHATPKRPFGSTLEIEKPKGGEK